MTKKMISSTQTSRASSSRISCVVNPSNTPFKMTATAKITSKWIHFLSTACSCSSCSNISRSSSSTHGRKRLSPSAASSPPTSRLWSLKYFSASERGVPSQMLSDRSRTSRRPRFLNSCKSSSSSPSLSTSSVAPERASENTERPDMMRGGSGGSSSLLLPVFPASMTRRGPAGEDAPSAHGAGAGRGERGGGPDLEPRA
mmetsp:Transcript_70232/g.199139  ORF Transcript_70232/g.199139 Transcript_70232/m.199139 type:complete len:200 (+) Transcript_70232:754-1353(+)